MSLKKYQQKRNFNLTSEPKGKKRASVSSLLYIIQKHAASHLHYDFRLELNGVLLSWAVPKGPSLDPAVKRLAVHVEDHPVEYGSFEGIIPAGQYGGGTVMLWDEGTWEPQDENPESAYKKGSMRFLLKGKKLKGLWKLIQIKKDPKNWLLMKLKDKYARPEKEYVITEKKPLSVKSRKTMEQIKKNHESARDKTGKSKTSTRKNKNKSTKDTALLDLLSNPERILYPEARITKLQLAEYYESIQDWILPYLIKRPLTLVRCPSGWNKACFFQKHISAPKNKALYSIKIKEKYAPGNYSYVKDIKGLIALVQLGVLEIHAWGCHINKVKNPDVIIFDLDPAKNVPWKKVIAAAKMIRKKLQSMKLKCFVKTTGGKGLHVVVPIKPAQDWDKAKEFSRAVVDSLIAENPGEFTATTSKSKRSGKIFIDYLRNQRGATAVAPYSTRAKKNAPVSTPLSWDELSTKIKSDTFTVKNLMKRLKSLKKDPWKEFYKLKQSL